MNQIARLHKTIAFRNVGPSNGGETALVLINQNLIENIALIKKSTNHNAKKVIKKSTQSKVILQRTSKIEIKKK